MGEKINIRSIVTTRVAYKKEERKEQKKRKNRNKKQKGNIKRTERE